MTFVQDIMSAPDAHDVTDPYCRHPEEASFVFNSHPTFTRQPASAPAVDISSDFQNWVKVSQAGS